MNPSRFRLPQQCSADRRRGRRATLLLRQRQYRFEREGAGLPGHPAPGFELPPFLATLPRGERFSRSKTARFLSHKLIAQLDTFMGRFRVPFAQPSTEDDYARLYGLMPRPRLTLDRWREDEWFARQRVAGVNPMSLARAEPPDAQVQEAIAPLLPSGTSVHGLLDQGRLFETNFEDLADPRIQAGARSKGRELAAPRCWFWTDPDGVLQPLAIRLLPPHVATTPIYTPQGSRSAWLFARCHAQAADAHHHEADIHLLQTHLITEVFAVASARHLHPDHPLYQLLSPHFEWNLAIDALARMDLLSVGGPIDNAMAAGVGGVLDVIRMRYPRFDFEKASVPRELAARGVDDASTLPFYPYREDGLRIWHAVERYVRSVLRVWYRSDQDVVEDAELSAWAAELASPTGGSIKGFPAAIGTVDQLVAIARDIVFRAGPQHAAVNNGQFDSYGFIPNTPGSLNLPVPLGTDVEAGPDELELFSAMPDRDRAFAQMAMSWILSEPTHRSLYGAGESEAFREDTAFEAHAAVDSFRRELLDIAAGIDRRNDTLDVPYVYLHPQNVARSTAT